MKFYFLESLLMSPETKTKLTGEVSKNVFEKSKHQWVIFVEY